MSEMGDAPVPSGASFRDPSGFLFTAQGRLYRQVNPVYRQHYEHLFDSGLYHELVECGLLLPHREVGRERSPESSAQAYRILEPELLDFVSYPFEWCFSQYKDAALATLEIQKRALQHGLWLKDGSAYNIQFHRGRPLLIDSLSFEVYPEGSPWIAYRQFCQHFLAPLCLMAYRDVRLGQLMRVFLDGMPLDLASRLLPFRTYLVLPLFIHIHLHAASQKRYAGTPVHTNRKLGRTALLELINSLEAAVRRLGWSPRDSSWADYYTDIHYGPSALEHKRRLVNEFLDYAQPRSVWDLGANTGMFSRLASQRGIYTVAFDLDPAAVEANYRQCVRAGEANLLPLVLDLTNPSPAIGWENRERQAFLERGQADAVMALALIHHLSISNNLPLDYLASFFQKIGAWLIVEFIPREDPQVQRLLASRNDIFSNYTVENFEASFSRQFEILRSEQLHGSPRRMFLMRRRQRPA